MGAVGGGPDDAALRVGHLAGGAEVVEVVIVDGGLPLRVAVDAGEGAEAVRLEQVEGDGRRGGCAAF